MRTALGVAFLILGVSVPAHASTLTASKTYRTDGITAIRVDFPCGDLFVSGSDDSAISVTMTARCKYGGSGCEQRARRIKLYSDTRGNVLAFRLEGVPKLNHGLQVRLQISMPRALAATVEMGAGDLNIRGLERDVQAHLGAGDVDVHAPEKAVGSVDVHVGIGDAGMIRGHHHVDGSGWLSKRLIWREGTGSARVHVELGVGDVGIALD